MHSGIGSAFLGDVQRIRLLSSSTPPSSPPGHSHTSSPMSTFFPNHQPSKTDSRLDTETPAGHAVHIDSALSLELRLRWLEAILTGVKSDTKGKEKENTTKNGETLVRAAEDIQRRLNGIVAGNDGLKRFMDHYDQHAHLLTPAFALSGITPPSYEAMSPIEFEAFLTEMEADVRAADRDMQEIETLENKGVTAAGKLSDYEALQPRLEALLRAHEDDIKMAAALEKRVAAIMERHATHVDALSELFVAWDDTITEAEDKVLRVGREKLERRRLGLE